MSELLNLEMEKSFRSVASALDELPESEAVHFLARLVLVLADELKDSQKMAQAVERARLSGREGQAA